MYGCHQRIPFQNTNLKLLECVCQKGVCAVVYMITHFFIDTMNTNTEFFLLFFFYLGFFSRTFKIHRTAGEGEGYFFKSPLALPPASQTLIHQLGDYCRELTSAHSQQSDSNREPSVSERKSLTTKLRAFKTTSSLWPVPFVKRDKQELVIATFNSMILKNSSSQLKF